MLKQLLALVTAVLLFKLLFKKRKPPADSDASRIQTPVELDRRAIDHQIVRQTTRQADASERQVYATWATVLVAVIALSISIVGAILLLGTFRQATSQTRAAWQQAQTAKAQLVASERAWLDVNADFSAAYLLWSDDGIMAVFSLVGENKGNSPAIDAQVFAVLTVQGSGSIEQMEDPTKKACQEQNAGVGGLGNVVFVKDKLAFKAYPDWPWREIEKDKLPLNLMFPEIIICAAYKIVGDGDNIHYTARVFDVVTPMNISKTMRPGSLKVVRDDVGEYAN